MTRTVASKLKNGMWFALKKTDEPRKACIVKMERGKVHVDFDSPKWFGYYNLRPTEHIWIKP